MRQISGFLILSLAAFLVAHASNIPIFTFDGNYESGGKKSTISQDAAQLLLERRMKSVDSSALGSSNDEVVECLNQFGGKQLSLFGAGGRREPSQRNLILLEGVDRHTFSSLKESFTNDYVAFHPSKDHVGDDFLAATLETDTTDRELCAFHPGDEEARQDARECLMQNPIIQEMRLLDSDLLAHVHSVDSLVGASEQVSAVRIQFKHGGPKSASLMNDLEAIMRRLAAAASEGKQQVTAVLSPDALVSRKPMQSLRSRHNKKEETSTKPFSQTSDRQESFSRPFGQHESVQSTLLPVCYASNSTCVDATNNCSGHGVCYKKYTAKNEGAARNCFACKCFETRVVKGDGKVQKIQWGGPACQKRDISSPFFLVAGVTVSVVVAVTMAVCMLFSTGQDELPSVIGAGVGSTRAQK